MLNGVDSTALQQIREFMLWFYDTFIDPLFYIMWNTSVLGVPLTYWFFGMSVTLLGVKFFRVFLGFDSDGSDGGNHRL